MIPVFAACQKYDPSWGDSWKKYIEWSGFHHIQEIVSTDSMLCHSLIETLIDEDWNFNVHADNRVHFFHDLDYLKRRIGTALTRANLLALFEEPTQEVEPLDGFTFCGYDILDSYDDISVLVNCGSFPTIYTPDDLNQYGLVSDLNRVRAIAQAIRDAHPEEPHCCECRVWGIARAQQ